MDFEQNPYHRSETVSRETLAGVTPPQYGNALL